MFSNRPEPKQSKRALNNTFSGTSQKPEIPDASGDIFDQLHTLPLREIPEDKPKDLYNRIVQMKVNLENEENAKKRIDYTQNQKVYKEELDKIIERKKESKESHKREEKIWFNEELRQVKASEIREDEQRQNVKQKVLEEKTLRQKMLEEKILKDDMAKKAEEENDKRAIEEAKRLLEIEKVKQEEARKTEKEKLLQI